jgi:nucleoside-diphosphate-sugar epimerase
MSVLVTGATGFLGRRLVRQLREDGLRVRCVVRGASDVAPLREFVGDRAWSGVDVEAADLLDPQACRRVLSGCHTVYHVAAGLTGGPAVLFLNTVVPTRTLIDASLAAGVRRFVLVSSLGVYGPQSLTAGTVLDEQCPVDPQPHWRDAYSYSKIVQERVAWEARAEHGLPLVVVRPGVIFGPGRGVFSARVGLQAGSLLVKMGGRQRLPYTYVDNCAAAVRLAGLADRVEGEAINVIDDDLPRAAELVRMYRRAGGRVRTVWVPRPLIGPLSGAYDWYHRWSGGQVPRVLTPHRSAALWKPLEYSNQKAKERLQWQPDVPFAEAFQRTVEAERGPA